MTATCSIPTDEAGLLERLRAGDEAACAELVRRFGGRLLATALRLLRCEADAADAVQDAFVSALRALGSFAGQSGLGTWLHRIVVNCCLMKLRSRSRRRDVPLDDLPPARGAAEPGGAALDRAETCARVRACIDRLPEPHRTVLVLRDLEELDTEATARRLGLTPGAVKTRLHRARQALRPLLGPLVGDGAAAPAPWPGGLAVGRPMRYK
jgi:RNA polymerase sigma-70 factor (ECF subfamily)